MIAAAVTGCLLIPGAASADQDPPGVVAVVQEVFPKDKKVSQVAKITRHSARIVPVTEEFLWPGDSVSLASAPKETELVIRVLATGSRVSIGADETDAARRVFVAGSATPGVSRGLAAFLMTHFLGQDLAGSGETMSGSRGERTAGPCFNAAGETNQPRTFDVPSLAAATNAVAPGKRDLLISWMGGAPPFAVELAKAGAEKPIVHREGITGGCAVRLGPVTLAPGKYRVSVFDANGATLTEPALSAETAPPPVPAEIAQSGLPVEARALYAATWLSGINHGQWAFEALQQVAALDCRSAAVKEWLATRGVVSPGCARGTAPGSASGATPEPETSSPKGASPKGPLAK